MAVDHDPGVRVYPKGESMLKATRLRPHRVTDQRGTDVTSLVDGSRAGAYFVGEPGDTLLVELMPPDGSPVPAPDPLLDPFEIDPGDKGGGGNGLRAGGAGSEALAGNMDALVLETSGILVQGRDESAVWRTVRKRYPREHFDEMLVDTLDQGPVRLVFVGRHKLRYVGRVLPIGTVAPLEFALESAIHSRLGAIAAGVLDRGGATTLLGPGDSLHLEFRASPVAPGKVRDFFLVSRGVYSSRRPATEDLLESRPVADRFELLQSQPNPFSRATRIDFLLPAPARARIEIFDMSGRRVRVVGPSWYPAGRSSIEWDGRDSHGNRVPAALYIYRLTAGRFRAQHKLMVLR